MELKNQKNIGYRAELDGLRAIAVLAVILFHAKFNVSGENIFTGGFLGVDIFFVISGYLITSILYNGFIKQDFSLLNFFERRARRILPIMLFVISLSIPFSLLLLLPSEFVNYSHQILSSIFFVSNFYFLNEDSYWSIESLLKPFLHTWSLGLEAQFYVFMALLLIWVARWPVLQAQVFLVTLAALSLCALHLMSLEDSESAFYLLPFRCWEFIVGATIATFKDTQLTKFKVNFLPTFGFTIVFISFFAFDRHIPHPSFYTVFPIFGVALVILFANAGDPITRLLRNKKMTSIGLISYGLYIWHFPIFSYLSHAKAFHENDVKLVAIASTFLVSIVTYFLIEKPFRSFSTVGSKLFLSIIGVWAFSLVVFGYFGANDGFAHRVPKLVSVPMAPDEIENHVWFHGNAIGSDRVILVGDSHLNAIAPVFKRWADQSGYQFAKSARGGCQLILNLNRVWSHDFSPTHCTIELQNLRMKFIETSKPSIVLFGGRLPLVVEEERFDNEEGGHEGDMSQFLQNKFNNLTTIESRQRAIKVNYEATLRRILDAGHIVVLLYPIPEVGVHVPKTLLSKVAGDHLAARDIVLRSPLSTSYEVYKKRTANSFRILDGVQHERLFRILPEEIFCDTEVLPGRCITHDSEHSFYRDDNHLTDEGALLILEKFKLLISSDDFRKFR